MNIFVLGLIYVIALLLQITFANLLSVYGIKPDFVLIYVIFISFKYGRLAGGVSGFFSGIIEDCFLTILFGLNALSKTFAGFIVSVIPWRLTGTKMTDAAFLLFIATLFHDFIYNWIYSFGTDIGVGFIFIRYAIPGAIYTTIFGMIVNAIFPNFFQVKYEQE